MSPFTPPPSNPDKFSQVLLVLALAFVAKLIFDFITHLMHQAL